MCLALGQRQPGRRRTSPNHESCRGVILLEFGSRRVVLFVCMEPAVAGYFVSYIRRRGTEMVDCLQSGKLELWLQPIQSWLYVLGESTIHPSAPNSEVGSALCK